MTGKVFELCQNQNREERADRLRAYLLGMQYENFIKRRAKLRKQAERILKIEKHAR